VATGRAVDEANVVEGEGEWSTLRDSSV